ncbi:unnamed protein product [Rotaria sordida]|uniref:Uncharacterized protein n=1 Tax=Rotaria sordida TaxID=392033 RepID=A0A815RDG5_9BILA|nr:unnamed protein product [Rotaria sordida]
MAISPVEKNRLCFEIMLREFRLQHMLAKVGGVKYNMTPAQRQAYGIVEAEKDNMMQELYTLMRNDNDI